MWHRVIPGIKPFLLSNRHLNPNDYTVIPVTDIGGVPARQQRVPSCGLPAVNVWERSAAEGAVGEIGGPVGTFL